MLPGELLSGPGCGLQVYPDEAQLDQGGWEGYQIELRKGLLFLSACLALISRYPKCLLSLSKQEQDPCVLSHYISRIFEVKHQHRKVENQIKMAKMVLMNELNKQANGLIEELEVCVFPGQVRSQG